MRPEDWYLDSKANRSHMRIRRHQLPIAPDFARTAYSLQGFTLLVGKVDLNLGMHADPVTGYVALSRFKKAEDVLILQPFELELFQQGVPEQATILHEHFARLPPGCASPGISAHLQQVNEQREQAAAEKRKRISEVRAESGKRSRTLKATRACVGCGTLKEKDQYTRRNWQNKDEAQYGKCKECVAAEKAARQRSVL